MAVRGWSEHLIFDTIQSPARTVQVRDVRHIPGTPDQRRDDPAIAYIAADGSYIVVNSLLAEVIAISDRNDPDWRTPWWWLTG
jgi:hypothetical protein